MPIYIFVCQDCNEANELLLKFKQPPPPCKVCGSENLIKQLSAPRFKLTGTGWYETDFKNSGANNKAESSTASAETKETATADKTTADKAAPSKATSDKAAPSKAAPGKATPEKRSSSPKKTGSDAE